MISCHYRLHLQQLHKTLLLSLLKAAQFLPVCKSWTIVPLEPLIPIITTFFRKVTINMDERTFVSFFTWMSYLVVNLYLCFQEHNRMQTQPKYIIPKGQTPAEWDEPDSHEDETSGVGVQPIARKPQQSEMRLTHTKMKLPGLVLSCVPVSHHLLSLLKTSLD